MDSTALLDRRSFVAALGATGLVGCRSNASGKVHILTGSGAGAPSGALMRLFARYLEKLGLSTTIENLPRAGGKLAAQRLAGAPTDGSVIAALPTGLLYAQLLGENGGSWDLTRFRWIGNFSSDRRVLVSSGQSGVDRFDQLIDRPKPLLLAATTATSPSFYEPHIVRHLTGARLQVVPGFVGGARNLAMISGEVDGVIAALDGLGPVLSQPGAHILLRLNDLPLPAAAVEQSRKAVRLRDVAHGPDAKPLVDLVGAHSLLGRLLALPPGSPPDVVALWRERFQRIDADPAFREEATAAQYELSAVSGEAVTENLVNILIRQRSAVEPALHRALDAASRADG